MLEMNDQVYINYQHYFIYDSIIYLSSTLQLVYEFLMVKSVMTES